MPIRLRTSLLILLPLALAFLFGARATASPLPTDLYRIGYPSQEFRTYLIQQEIIVLDEGQGAENEPYLVAALTPEFAAKLETRGGAVQWLETFSQNHVYFTLFYPDVLALEALQASGIPIVLRENNTTLVRLPTTDSSLLDDAKIRYRRLFPHPFVEQTASPRAFLRSPAPAVSAMLAQVDTNRLSGLVGGLSGEWPVNVGGEPYTFNTRYSRLLTPTNKATRYTYDYLETFGLTLDYEYYTLPYSGERRNVIAEQTGVTEPERIFMLVAHLDSNSNDPYNIAPGADDNASGSAGLMMAAEILSQYEFACTLRYALFTGEEQGYYGSAEYAKDVYNRGETIEGVLNLDMIGYDSDAYPTMEIHTRYQNASDLFLASLFSDVVTMYNLDLNVQIVQDTLSWSDHSSFWDYGYPAVLVMEDWQDFTPHYHHISDTLATLNIDYQAEIVKAAIGVMAHSGCGIVSATPTPTPTPTTTTTPTHTPIPPTLLANYLPIIVRVKASPTITPTPSVTLTPTATPSCSNVVINGGFENDLAWELPETISPAAFTTTNVRSGSRSMRIGIEPGEENIASYSSARQLIDIPTNANTTLSFWRYRWSGDANRSNIASPPSQFAYWAERSPLGYDAQYVLVLSESGQVLATLDWDVKNDLSWENLSFDLSPYAGQRIKLHFGVYNDGIGGVTGMYIDDVVVSVCP